MYYRIVNCYLQPLIWIHSLLKRPGLRVAGTRTTALFSVIATDLCVYVHRFPACVHRTPHYKEHLFHCKVVNGSVAMAAF